VPGRPARAERHRPRNVTAGSSYGDLVDGHVTSGTYDGLPVHDRGVHANSDENLESGPSSDARFAPSAVHSPVRGSQAEGRPLHISRPPMHQARSNSDGMDGSNGSPSMARRSPLVPRGLRGPSQAKRHSAGSGASDSTGTGADKNDASSKRRRSFDFTLPPPAHDESGSHAHHLPNQVPEMPKGRRMSRGSLQAASGNARERIVDVDDEGSPQKSAIFESGGRSADKHLSEPRGRVESQTADADHNRSRSHSQIGSRPRRHRYSDSGSARRSASQPRQHVP